MSNSSEIELQRRLLRRFIPVVRDLRNWLAGKPLPPIRRIGNQTIHLSENPPSVVFSAPPSPLPPAIIPPSECSSELEGIAGRCSVKANGCTWASERLQLQVSGADHRTEIAPYDVAIIEQGKQHEVGLWMNFPSAPVPNDPTEYDTLAGCYETLANAVHLMSLVESSDSARSSHLPAAMALMAEAQSMLRAGVQNIGGPNDSEQTAAFWWLRQRAEETKVYIERFMRVEDQADPEQWHRLLAEVSEVEEHVEQTIKREKIQRKLLSKLKYKLQQLETSDDKQDQLAGVDRTVNELVNNGLPPSSVELRELVSPHRATINAFESKSTGLSLTLREISGNTKGTTGPRENSKPKRLNKEVTEVAELLQGRSIALIGGDCRLEAKLAIEEAFGLAELVWIETQTHQSYHTFKPVVERSDIAVVLLAIRWSSHSYGEVHRFCKDSSIPLVRLPTGYNANQIAAQILKQCSDQLSAVSTIEESTQ